MKFDDFNYDVYNPYILIEEVKNKDKNQDDADGKKSESRSKATTQNLQLDMGVKNQPGLSALTLENNAMDRYDFPALSVKSPDDGDSKKVTPMGEKMHTDPDKTPKEGDGEIGQSMFAKIKKDK